MTTNNINNRAPSAPLTPPRTTVTSGVGEGLTEAATTVSATAAAPAEAPKKRGLLGHIADVFIGGGEAIGDMVKGIATVITHPIQTLKGLGYVITHPAALVHAFVEPYKEAIREGRPGKAIGRGIVEVGSLFVGPAEIANGVKGATNAIKGIFKGGQAGGVIGMGGAAAAGSAAATAAAGAVTVTEKAAKTASGLLKAAEKSTQRADVLAKAGKAAEAANMVAYAGFLDEAGKAIQAGADAAEVMSRVRYVSTGGNIAAATGTLSKGATVLANTAEGAAIAAMMPAVKGADAVLKGASTIDDLAKVGTAAAKSADEIAKVVVSTKPVLTKTAITELAKVGIKDSGKISGALDEAAKIYQAQKAAGATTAAAKQAAQAAAAGKLGLDAGSKAVEKLVNGVRLQGAAANPANYFTRTNYVRAPLHKAAEAVGKPIDLGIVAAREAGEQAAALAGKAGETISRGVQRLGEVTLRELITAPFTLPAQAIKGAGRIISNGLAAISDLPLREILTAPIRGVGNAVKAGAQALGKVGDLTLRDIITAPAHLANMAMANPAALYRPAVTMGLLGRLGEGVDTKSDSSDLAKRYGLDPSAENIAAFKKEVAGYAENAIGPDSGTPEQISQLQSVLRGLGYDVEASGKFDEATALAVIDFKEKNDITQSYVLANGKPAINEYVDEGTARAMVDELQAKKGTKPTAPAFDPEALEAHLADLDSALKGLAEAPPAQKKSAMGAVEETAIVVISDLVRKARTDEKGSAEAGTQMDKIAEQLSKAGFSDDQIYALIEEAKVLADKPAETEEAEKPASPEGLDVDSVAKDYQNHAEALSKALDALGSAKTDAEKTKAKKAVEESAVDAITDLAKLAHSDEESVQKTVSEEMGGLADALSEAGFSEDDIMKLVEAGRLNAKEALASAAKPETDAETKPGKGEEAEETEPTPPGATGNQPTRPTDGATAGPRPGGPAVPSNPPVYHTVKRGDSLSAIAKQELGDANRWREIYDLNKQVIGPNPNLILPGQKLRLPEAGEPKTEGELPKLPPKTEKPAEPAKPTKPSEPTTKPGTLTESQIKDLVKQHKIMDEPANVKAFVDELMGYRESAIGPDAGTPEVVRQLQTLLTRLGYEVSPSGKFDDATADAIIDFKQKNGLHQDYKLADGTWAINEYVGEDVAKAIVAALPKGGAPATPVTPGKPAEPAKPAEPPKDSKPAEPAKPAEPPKGSKPAEPAKPAEPPKGSKPAEPAKPAEPPKGSKPAEPAKPAPKTVKVANGDSLSRIAQRELGDGNRWREIYDLNKDVIGPNPNVIQPGQSLKLPG